LNELAETMTLPFSWPAGADLAAAVRKAEFSEVRVEARSLPLAYEGGVKQVIAALAGAPIGPALAEFALHCPGTARYSRAARLQITARWEFCSRADGREYSYGSEMNEDRLTPR
jgi:hypothetical protein